MDKVLGANWENVLLVFDMVVGRPLVSWLLWVTVRCGSRRPGIGSRVRAWTGDDRLGSMLDALGKVLAGVILEDGLLFGRELD